LQRALTTVFLIGLLLATAAAFALTEHLKLIKSPIYATRVTGPFSPVCGCATDKATIGFKLRKADTVTVRILDADGNVVATIASGVREPAGTVTFLWDGGKSPDGSYQPQIKLAQADKTIVMPNRITLDTSVPQVLSASDGHGTLVPGGRPKLSIVYTLDQRAHVVVYLGSDRVILGRRNQLHDGVIWNGKLHGKTLPPGRYVLDVGAVDIAGNETPLARRKHVVVHIEAHR
jgi:hypothetical protein